MKNRMKSTFLPAGQGGQHGPVYPNLIPNYENKTLTVELYSLSTPRENAAAKEICDILNEYNAIYPGTDLRLIYKLAT